MRSSSLFGSVLLALGVAIVLAPWYIVPVCEVFGQYVQTAMGTQIPMACGWTARAEIGIGASIACVGAVLLAFGKRKETARAFGVVGSVLGAFAILFPTYLIGVCASIEHPCVLGTRPVLLLLGALTIVASLALILTAKEG